jgi:hypothetical protein
MDGMVIDLFGIRFEEVLNAPVIGDAHDSIILADEAYAITKLAGEGNVRVITKGLGSAGVSDPLDQRQSIGYKITGFSAAVLRSESVVNYWSVPSVAGAGVDFTDLSQPAAEAIGGEGIAAPVVVTFVKSGETDITIEVQPGTRLSLAALGAGVTTALTIGQETFTTAAEKDAFVVVEAISVTYA